jgi:hypothetical protein
MAEPRPVPVPQISSYYAVLYASSDELANSLVATMVRRGYTIGPLGRQLVTKAEDNPAASIAFSIFRVPRDDEERKAYTAVGIYNEVSDVIKFLKGKFWGLAVGITAEFTWGIGNISIAKESVELAKKMN